MLDAGLAAAVAALSVLGTLLVVRDETPGPAGIALLVICAAPLVVRRTHPAGALGLTVSAILATSLLDFHGGFYTIALAIELWTAADDGRRWLAVAGAGTAVGGTLGIGVLLGRGHVVDGTNALWFGGWLVASLVLGEVTRSRRAYLREVERRAIEAERTREEEARRRAGEERIRIARELHDVLAHRISSITVQAGVGLHLLDREPEQARAALVAINEASRQALRELRSTLGVLRQVDEPEPRAPSPGLSQLAELIADVGRAGLAVRIEVQGAPRDLPSGVDLAAYRIIQESLTNVIRHARAATARVAIAYRRADVVIQVVDDGVGESAGPRERGGGNGIVGMRERASALGGELEAGPGPAGGFRVRARLPLEAPA